MEALVAETGADELIVVSDVYEHPARLRSFELIAEAAGAARTARRSGGAMAKSDGASPV